MISTTGIMTITVNLPCQTSNIILIIMLPISMLQLRAPRLLIITTAIQDIIMDGTMLVGAMIPGMVGIQVGI